MATYRLYPPLAPKSSQNVRAQEDAEGPRARGGGPGVRAADHPGQLPSGRAGRVGAHQEGPARRRVRAAHVRRRRPADLLPRGRRRPLLPDQHAQEGHPATGEAQHRAPGGRGGQEARLAVQAGH